jgi:hypothetical protein
MFDLPAFRLLIFADDIFTDRGFLPVCIRLGSLRVGAHLAFWLELLGKSPDTYFCPGWSCSVAPLNKLS